MKLYTVNKKYVDYLKLFDNRVPDIIYDNDRIKPFTGIVLNVNNINYFAPLTSPKPKHLTMRSNPSFYKIDNGNLGLININNMIPVHEKYLTQIDFKTIESNYRNLFESQIRFIRKDKTKILSKANKLYKLVISKKELKLNEICCDFKLLETAYHHFADEYVGLSNIKYNLMKKVNREIYNINRDTLSVTTNRVASWESYYIDDYMI